MYIRRSRFISLTVALMATLFFQRPSHAAVVDCSFMTGTKVNSNGEWVKAYDYMSLLDVFTDSLRLKISNSLLGRLDSKQPFYVGSVKRGKVYLMGGDMGIEGKLINKEGNSITIYNAMCSIEFG